MAKPSGQKHDSGKRRFLLLPWRELGIVVDVLEHGAAKYGVHNWTIVPHGKERYLDAALRHLHAVILGETHDPESGLPHLAHATCSLLFALWFQSEEQALDVVKESAR